MVGVTSLIFMHRGELGEWHSVSFLLLSLQELLHTASLFAGRSGKHVLELHLYLTLLLLLLSPNETQRRQSRFDWGGHDGDGDRKEKRKKERNEKKKEKGNITIRIYLLFPTNNAM